MPGFSRVFDSSANLKGHFGPPLVLASTDYAAIRYPTTWPTSATENTVGDATPWVLAAGDVIQFGVIYEAAP
jgi:hypothetical protein